MSKEPRGHGRAAAENEPVPTMLLHEQPQEEQLKLLAQHFPGLNVQSVSTLLALVSASTKLLSAMESHFSGYGLSQGRFALLMVLLGAPEHAISPSGLAERVGVTRGTVTSLLDGLERAKLVKREPDPKDRRALIIRLTPKGLTLLGKMLPNHFAKVSQIAADFTEQEHDKFTQLLKKFEGGLAAISAQKPGQARKETRSVVVVPRPKGPKE